MNEPETINEILDQLGNWWRNGYVESPKRYPEIDKEKAKQAIDKQIRLAELRARINELKDIDAYMGAKTARVESRVALLKYELKELEATE